jgi:hypothetical protein
MKIGTEGSEAYFRTNSHAPPFGGVAPRNMKIGRKLGFYFRINSQCLIIKILIDIPYNY